MELIGTKTKFRFEQDVWSPTTSTIKNVRNIMEYLTEDFKHQTNSLGNSQHSLVHHSINDVESVDKPQISAVNTTK